MNEYEILEDLHDSAEELETTTREECFFLLFQTQRVANVASMLNQAI